MTFNQEGLNEVDYLCIRELPPGLSADHYHHQHHHHLVNNSNSDSHNNSYQDLTCSEVLPSPGEMVDMLPQSSFLPTTSATMGILTSMDPSLCPHSSSSIPSSPLSSGPPAGASARPGVCTGGGGSPHQFRPTLHVEVCQLPESTLRCSRLKELVLSMLRQRGTSFGELFLQDFEDPVMKEHIQSVSITDVPYELKLLDFRCLPLVLHVYRLHQDGPLAEELEEGEDTACSSWTLPAVEFHGLWDNLIYDMDIKQNLLNYAESTLLFSDRGVDPLIISWNRVVLLHGPPGTGKTSLCKALAQKLSVRLSHRYSYGQLVEINSHSLFSKWFSESGKLVQKMFQKLHDMISDPAALVCVLIDEVESLTSARTSAFRGSEPSDAIRVVNALLTQLDQIRRYHNVLILTTSNVTGAIDIAFIDRADIKQYIGVPTVEAIYKIYHSCIKELTRVGIISPTHQLLDLRTLEVMRFLENDTTRLSLQLRHIARQSEGLSGRTLRKLPFLAHALLSLELQEMSLCQFLSGLERAVLKQIAERNELASMAIATQ